MIEGFKIDVKGTELQALLRKRVERKQKRVGEMEKLLADAPRPRTVGDDDGDDGDWNERLLAIAPELRRVLSPPDILLPPVPAFPGRAQMRAQVQAQSADFRAEVIHSFIEGEKKSVQALAFIADHIIIGETYRLDVLYANGLGMSGYHQIAPMGFEADMDEIAALGLA